MHALHFMADGWTLMTHGNLFVGHDYQGSDRGDQKFLSANWVMLMARHRLAGGDLGLRGMASVEPLTVGRRGIRCCCRPAKASREFHCMTGSILTTCS